MITFKQFIIEKKYGNPDVLIKRHTKVKKKLLDMLKRKGWKENYSSSAYTAKTGSMYFTVYGSNNNKSDDLYGEEILMEIRISDHEETAYSKFAPNINIVVGDLSHVWYSEIVKDIINGNDGVFI